MDGRIALVLIEIFEGVLEADCGILRIERVSGLAGGEAIGLGLHGGRNAGKLDGADAHRRRGDSEVDGGDFLWAQAAGEIGFHRRLDALAGEHFFERLTDSFEQGAIGGHEAVIERKARVKLVIEFFARLKWQIVQVNGEELAGGRQ